MKKFIISLFVGLFGLVSFGYCSYYMSTFTNISIQYGHSETLSPGCYRVGSAGAANYLYFSGYFDENDNYVEGYKLTNVDWLYCSDEEFLVYYPGGGNSSYYVRFYDIFSVFSGASNCPTCPTCPTCPDCPACDECSYSGYILESDIDTNYCVSNGYCPNACGSGGDYSGDLQFSNLYINDILHPGKSNIFVTIPDYIQWDYSTTETDFNLYVGSGYDMDYMNSIIDINSYRPDSGDFTNIFVSGLTLIFPYIFVALLIVFIWKLLKRIFR